MDNGYTENVSNGLRVCVDWLAFTLSSSSADDAVQFLGLDRSEFEKLPKGMHGYMSRMRHFSLAVDILFDGREDMGTHVIIAGSAVHDVLVSYHSSRLELTPFGDLGMDVTSFDTTVLREFLNDVTYNGQVTRLDLAIDDLGGQYYSISDIRQRLTDGSYLSKFRGWREISSHVNGQPSGNTIYMGSAQSAIMLRIYDKQAEQNLKLSRDGQPLIETPWIRWEMELKKERAHKACTALATGMTVQDVAIGTLKNYIRFVVKDNVRIERCTMETLWESFCNGVHAMSLYVPTPPKTIDDTKRWLMHQVSASLAKVVIDDCGDSAFIHNMLHAGVIKLGRHDESALEFI